LSGCGRRRPRRRTKERKKKEGGDEEEEGKYDGEEEGGDAAEQEKRETRRGGERRDKTNGNPRAAAALAAQGCEQKGGGRKAHLGHGCHRCGGGLDLAAQHLQGLVRGRGVGARLLQPLDGELQRLLQDLILGRERGTVLLVLLILLGAGVHLLGVRRRHLDGNSIFLLLVGHAPGEL